MPSLRGPCGTIFHFYSCDLSFNGTTPQRGQIPCILYYSTPLKNDSLTSGNSGSMGYTTEGTTRETALQVASDITKKCTELLILARNALAVSNSPSDNSSSTHHTQTIDSEHNITPIEEHMDINWVNNTRTSALPTAAAADPHMTHAARDITKRIESFSKGIMETLKFDKRSTNPFEMEIEIGATEIHPKDLSIIEETADLNYRNGEMAKFNGNERDEDEVAEDFVQQQSIQLVRSESEEVAVGTSGAAVSSHMTSEMLEIFNLASSNMFHKLLPLVYAHIATLACSDPKSSVQILGLIKDILPHIAALNQLHIAKESNLAPLRNIQRLNSNESRKRLELEEQINISTTTSNHYCIVESDHPYRSASISCYRVEFPSCVQWMTLEFDPQCGTAQLEDYLTISIPLRSSLVEQTCQASQELDNNSFKNKQSAGICKNASIISSFRENSFRQDSDTVEQEWIIVKKFNT